MGDVALSKFSRAESHRTRESSLAAFAQHSAAPNHRSKSISINYSEFVPVTVESIKFTLPFRAKILAPLATQSEKFTQK